MLCIADCVGEQSSSVLRRQAVGVEGCLSLPSQPGKPERELIHRAVCAETRPEKYAINFVYDKNSPSQQNTKRRFITYEWVAFF